MTSINILNLNNEETAENAENTENAESVETPEAERPYEESHGKVQTIHSGSCIKFNGEIYDIQHTLSGTIRYHKKDAKIIIV